MEINYIKEFVILAQTQNFLEASEILFIAQSSLSKHIARLEQELGEPLFDRTTRKVELNDAGKLFLTYAKEISRLDSSCKHEFKERKKQLENSITIGMGYRLFEPISAFCQKYNNYKLNIIEGSSETEIISLLKTQKCDVGFSITSHISDEDIIQIPYLTEQYVAVFPVSHPLAQKEAVSLEELKNENFIMLPEESSVTQFVLQSFRRKNLKMHIALTGFHGNNILDFVQQNIGISIMPQYSVSNITTPEIRLVNITPVLSTDVVICYRKNTKLSPGARAFIQFALETRPGNIQ